MQTHIYHIHDTICKHASNTLEEVVAYALKHGYKELYYTEHGPVSFNCIYRSRRAEYWQVQDLKHRIDLVNKKYKGRLHVYFGYEIEFNKQNRWYYERVARDPIPEFLIMGNHFHGDLFKMDFPLPLVMNTTDSVAKIKTFDEINKAAMSSGLFSWLPHPEIFLNSWQKWDAAAQQACKNIIKFAKQYKLPLGFNVNFKEGQPKPEWHYPVKRFWKLVAKTNIPVIIESDSHDLHTVKTDWLANARKLALSYGLKKNLKETIKINWLPKKPLMVLYEKDLFKYISKNIVAEMKKQNVKFVEINSKSNIKSICLKNKVHPVWTLALTKNASLLKQIRQTSIYLISDKYCDLTLKELSQLSYKGLIKSFLKEA